MNEKITCADCKHFNARNNVCAVLENTVRPGYGCYEGEERIVTNADKIRSMSDEALIPFVLRATLCIDCPAKDVCDRKDKDCVDNIIGWLREEAKDE